MQDPQSMPGTFCPLNKFGLFDYERLHLLEAPAVHRRQVQLDASPMTGAFDAGRLRKIHWFLFRDVYPWAGEFRVVEISKVGGAPFAMPQFIASSLSDVFSQLKSENDLKGKDRYLFAQRASFYLGEINAIHPFREGNGRTQRELIRQLATNAGLVISWAGISREENTAASILSHMNGDNSGLAKLIERAILDEVSG